MNRKIPKGRQIDTYVDMNREGTKETDRQKGT